MTEPVDAQLIGEAVRIVAVRLASRDHVSMVMEPTIVPPELAIANLDGLEICASVQPIAILLTAAAMENASVESVYVMQIGARQQIAAVIPVWSLAPVLKSTF